MSARKQRQAAGIKRRLYSVAIKKAKAQAEVEVETYETVFMVQEHLLMNGFECNRGTFENTIHAHVDTHIDQGLEFWMEVVVEVPSGQRPPRTPLIRIYDHPPNSNRGSRHRVLVASTTSIEMVPDIIESYSATELIKLLDEGDE